MASDLEPLRDGPVANRGRWEPKARMRGAAPSSQTQPMTLRYLRGGFHKGEKADSEHH